MVALNLYDKIITFYMMSALDKWSYFSSMFSINSYQELLDARLFTNRNLQFNKKPLLFKYFTMRGVITIADIWDGTKKDFISNVILLEKLHVHNSSISEWFTIKTVVRNVYGHFLKQSNGNSNVCNVLASSDSNRYTPNGNLVKTNKLKSKGTLSQLKRTSNIHL